MTVSGLIYSCTFDWWLCPNYLRIISTRNLWPKKASPRSLYGLFRRLMSRMIIFFMYEKRHCDQLFAQSRNVACVDFSLLGENAICSHNGGKILMGWNFSDICICERKVCNVSFGIVSLIKSVFLVWAKARKTFNYGEWKKEINGSVFRVCMFCNL